MTRVQPFTILEEKQIERLYKERTPYQEISNLTNIPKHRIVEWCKEKCEQGIFVPRRAKRDPSKPKVEHIHCGQGGRSCERRKFTKEQEQEILIDYFDNDMSGVAIMEKWGMYRETFKGIVDRAIKSGERQPKRASVYGKKRQNFYKGKKT